MNEKGIILEETVLLLWKKANNKTNIVVNVLVFVKVLKMTKKV